MKHRKVLLSLLLALVASTVLVDAKVGGGEVLPAAVYAVPIIIATYFLPPAMVTSVGAAGRSGGGPPAQRGDLGAAGSLPTGSGRPRLPVHRAPAVREL